MNNYRRETMFGFAINKMFASLESYAKAHLEAYESPIGDDYVIGAHWLSMAAALVGLLNGETGRIDCGDMDRDIRRLARDNGFTEKQADTLEWE